MSEGLHSKTACTDLEEYVITDYDYRVIVLTMRRGDVNAISEAEVSFHTILFVYFQGLRKAKKFTKRSKRLLK